MKIKIPAQKTEVAAFSTRSTKEWEEAGRANALILFQEAAERVPAYQKFLRTEGVDPKSIKSHEDFIRLPFTDKENYLRKYPLNELCWDGKITSAQMVSVSSGSTGEPSFWPHGTYMQEVGEWYYGLIFEQNFQVSRQRTLVVVCYTLGTWMAGTHTLIATESLANQGMPITVVSPGINKAEVLKCIKKLSPLYDQTVLIGYPPFVKDILDEGALAGIDWKTHNIKMMYGGEPFSEAWRDYVLEKVGSQRPLLDTANVYAAADCGIMGVETPTSIAIHRYAAENQAWSEHTFASSRVPTLQQYHPAMRYFETTGDELVVTTNNSVPLVRYRIRDTGGIITFEEMTQLLGGRQAADSLHQNTGEYLCTMPFVYVFGRAHNTATLYALNVYPENVRAAAEDRRLHHWLSGKVRLATEYTDTMDQYLHITMELAPGISLEEVDRAAVAEVTFEKLRLLNAEYNRLTEELGDRARPKITLVSHGDTVFRPGAKMAKAEVVRS